jgi:preprotein translocase subunit SecG
MFAVREWGGGRFGYMRTFLIILETLASLALTVVVLMQSGKEAGLSGALSGSSDSYLSKNKKGGLDQVLATSTKWIAIVWVVLTLVLSLV